MWVEQVLDLEKLRNRMVFPVQRIVKPKSWRRQGVGILCCLLGLIWVGHPIFHNVCHLVDLPHQHPEGSAFGHDHGQRHGHGRHHGHSHGHSHGHGHGHAHDVPSRHLPDDRLASGQTPGADPESPHREPSDGEGPLLFMQSLETEICGSADHCALLKQSPPALGVLNFDSVDFFSSAELGTIGARGPPIILGFRYLPKV